MLLSGGKRVQVDGPYMYSSDGYDDVKFQSSGIH